MVDTLVLGTSAKSVRVRVPPPVLNRILYSKERFGIVLNGQPQTSYLYNYNICTEIFTEFKMILLNTDR